MLRRRHIAAQALVGLWGAVTLCADVERSRHELLGVHPHTLEEDTMTDTITVTGLVATEPRHITTQNGLTITSFRLASNQRRFDRGQNAWIDGDTNWYTVTAFRQLGMHVASSVRKGERVVVAGRVRQRDWQSDTNKGTTIEIDADTVGHDLTFGRSTFTRTVKASSSASPGGGASPAEGQPADADRGDAAEQVSADVDAAAPF